MNKTVAIFAGLVLTGGVAMGEQQEAGTESRTAETYGTESGTGLSGMTAEELRGRAVLTAEGEEIGAIREVGFSESHEARVATVDVGGFVGAGQKLIAIPLAELSEGSDDSIVTSMTRESIETRAAFDEAELAGKK